MTLPMSARPWASSYPAGVPLDLPDLPYATLVDLIDANLKRCGHQTAYSFLGQRMSFSQVDQLSLALAAYFQGLGLEKGARVALMMPNCFQYPVSVAAVLRAGLVLVNVNPLYTARELEHQLADSGATTLIILDRFAQTLQHCLARTPIRHVLVTGVGDLLGRVKGPLINFVMRHVRRKVPSYQLPRARGLVEALETGRRQLRVRPWQAPDLLANDIALLQYTGGTTGVAKGAVLLHRQLLANILQTELWNRPAMETLAPGTQMTMVCALPLYHIYAFTVGLMYTLSQGGQLILIPNPRDVSALIRTLRRQVFHIFPAVNTLFAALLRHPKVHLIDWQHVRVTVGGGMAVSASVAEQWKRLTNRTICEGYGLTETSPSVSCNPVVASPGAVFDGSIGWPLPGTWVRVVDETGLTCPLGQAGEIEIRGPQLMAGYWQKPEETAMVMTADGWLKTGDIGQMDACGKLKIIDRKKDMILVSGFNVYPVEVEDVVARMPGVQECACVGVPDPETGEAVRLVVVASDPALSKDQISAWCRQQLTGYKQPKQIEFCDELPKTTLGKVLRRALREQVTSASRVS
jgi:long-chain acyl-CoA synthetase